MNKQLSYLENIKGKIPESLYNEVYKMTNRSVLTDMCEIGKSLDKVDTLIGCQKTTIDRGQLNAERDINLKAIADDFDKADKIKERKAEIIRKKQDDCLNEISALCKDIEKKTSSDQPPQLPHLYKVVEKITSLNILTALYKKKINSEKDLLDSYNSQFIDNYWKELDKRDFAVHNVLNESFVMALNPKTKLLDYNTSETIIEGYSSSLSLEEKDVIIVSGKIEEIQQQKLRDIFQKCLLGYVKKINMLIEDNYLAIVLPTFKNETIFTSLDNIYLNNRLELQIFEEIEKFSSYNEISKNKLSPVDILLENIEKEYKELQKLLEKFYDSISIYDTEKSKNDIVNSLKKIECTKDIELLEDKSDDVPYLPEIKIIPSNTESYDITDPRYWMKFTTFLNKISALPTHWAKGIILPNGVKMPLPIIYTFVKVLYAEPILTVTWLTVNGMIIFPVILTVDFTEETGESEWKTLFKGNNKIKKGSTCEIPIDEVSTDKEVEVNEKKETVSSVDDTKKMEGLPFSDDDYPIWDRMSMDNTKWIGYLNEMCAKAKPKMGF